MKSRGLGDVYKRQVLKMRRRKGLGDTVAVSTYLEHEMAVALAQAGMDIA